MVTIPRRNRCSQSCCRILWTCRASLPLCLDISGYQRQSLLSKDVLQQGKQATYIVCLDAPLQGGLFREYGGAVVVSLPHQPLQGRKNDSQSYLPLLGQLFGCLWQAERSSSEF
jgi:hypothetical protein